MNIGLMVREVVFEPIDTEPEGPVVTPAPELEPEPVEVPTVEPVGV